MRKISTVFDKTSLRNLSENLHKHKIKTQYLQSAINESRNGTRST